MCPAQAKGCLKTEKSKLSSGTCSFPFHETYWSGNEKFIGKSYYSCIDKDEYGGVGWCPLLEGGKGYCTSTCPTGVTHKCTY